MHLFDHTVKPILLYASEIWGTFNTNLSKIKRNPDHKLERAYEKLPAENLHLKMCRYLLGVNPKTPIDAIRGETGRLPLYNEIVINLLKYYNYINNDGTELLKDALASNKEMYTNGKQCWLNTIHLVLEELQLSPEDICQPLLTWLPQTKRDLHSRYVSKWRSRLTRDNLNTHGQGNKLRTYNQFKLIFGKETYLDTLRNKDVRRSLVKFRTSSHQLHIETGRYEKPYKKPELRVCHICNSGQIENELHFLTECTTYNQERENLYTVARKHCQNFDALHLEDKMIWLLSAENTQIIYSLAQYIHLSFKTRKSITHTNLP